MKEWSLERQINVDDIKFAIKKVIKNRLSKGVSVLDIRNYLSHLKRDVWKNDKTIIDYIDETMKHLEN